MAALTYKEIKADILGRIMGGEWQPGSLLPGEADLAGIYGSSRATVNRAMRELVDDGIIERKRKAGTRVRASPLRQARFDIPVVRREIEDQGAAYRYVLISSEVGPAPDWLRARMGLAKGARARHVICLHVMGDAPYQHEDRWISMTALPQVEAADFSASGPNEWLITHIPFSEVEISISATSADAPLARHLGCAIGDPLLLVERATWWEGKAVTYVRLTHRSGHRMTTRY